MSRSWLFVLLLATGVALAEEAPEAKPEPAATPAQEQKTQGAKQKEDDVGEERDARDIRPLAHALALHDPVAVRRDQQEREQQHPP